MNFVLRIFLIFVLLVAALICAFGFLTTFQMPMPQRLFAQLLYGGGGVVCMFIIMRLAMPRPK